MWIVYWHANGHDHYAVLGDTWLQTGAHSDWGPHVADQQGRPFDPTYRLRNVSNSYPCNSNGWDYMTGPLKT